MFDKQSVGLTKYFLKGYPRRTALMVMLLLFAGLAEAVGLVTLLPLLEVAAADGSPSSGLGRAVEAALGRVGLGPTLGVLLIIIVLGMSIKAGFVWLAGHQVGYTTARIATDLRLMLIRALLGARWEYFSSQPIGHVANSISNEAYRAARAYREVCSLLAGVIHVAVYVVVAVLVSWEIAVFALLGGVGIAYALRTFVWHGRQAGGGETMRAKALVARMTDALQGMKPIKAMGREGSVLPLLEHETFELNEAVQGFVRATETRKAFYEPLLVLFIAVGLYATLTFTDQPFSALMVMAFLFHRVAGHINSLQAHYQMLAGYESAFWSLREQAERAEKEGERHSGTRRPTGVEREIALQGVSFSYGDHEVLDEVSLTIPAGAFVAIVGPSGAGKTTIADLVVGLHRPQGGRVLIDGRSLEELDIRAWRHMIGYVPQEMLLFHDTLLRNVTLGAEDISQERVWEALRKAGAFGFVEKLPEGLETVIGERGTKLSGGQRQRVAIARALVRDPALLVLDEVTTALDPHTEAEICRTLGNLGRGVTVIAISHQPALNEAANLVYRLENGRVSLERGLPDPAMHA